MTPTELEIIAHAEAVEANLAANSTDVSDMTFEEFMAFCATPENGWRTADQIDRNNI